MRVHLGEEDMMNMTGWCVQLCNWRAVSQPMHVPHSRAAVRFVSYVVCAGVPRLPRSVAHVVRVICAGVCLCVLEKSAGVVSSLLQLSRRS